MQFTTLQCNVTGTLWEVYNKRFCNFYVTLQKGCRNGILLAWNKVYKYVTNSDPGKGN